MERKGKFVSIGQFARDCGVSPRMARGWCDAGEVRINGTPVPLYVVRLNGRRLLPRVHAARVAQAVTASTRI